MGAKLTFAIRTDRAVDDSMKSAVKNAVNDALQPVFSVDGDVRFDTSVDGSVYVSTNLELCDLTIGERVSSALGTESGDVRGIFIEIA